MVGVAGKSKGCTTCRRRKVRCGQERPQCSRCVQAGRLCEGYERFPVFINRTAQGLQKRRPLEETKADLTVSDLSTVIVINIGISSNQLPSSPSARQVWSANFLGWFWENYSPHNSPSSTAAKGPMWLYHAINITHPTEALRQSLLALSIVRRGRFNNDSHLLNEGRRIYGQALRVLQKDLYHRQRASHEETLAATRAMVLYELYESTSNTAGSWQYHVSGLASLIKSRGPLSYSTPLARAVFEEFRYPLSIQSITLRKGYALAEPLWLTAPWANAIKDKEQILYDFGFSLACLLEQIDMLAKLVLEYSASIIDNLLCVMKSILELISSLNIYKADHLSRSQILSNTDTGPSHFQPQQKYIQQDESGYMLETLIMTWWAFTVILAFASKRVAAIAHQGDLCLPNFVAEAFIESIEQLEAFYNNTSRDRIGRKILAIIDARLQGDTSHFWLSRTIFPLTAAALQFQQPTIESAICERLKDYITEKKGFRFAQRVRSQPGLHISFTEGFKAEVPYQG